jgi:hypothetical protein
MTNTPEFHRDAERRFIEHALRLLGDERLRIDTTLGRRPVTSLIVSSEQSDHGVDVKRLMSEMNRPDRELQQKLPTGQAIDVTIAQKKFLGKRPVGRLRVMCVSPMRELIGGESAPPLNKGDVECELAKLPPSDKGVPQTIALLSTAGYTIEAHELAERRADRTLILVEPNGAGGFNVYGPVETKAVVDLFDPEAEDEKRRRIRGFVDAQQSELAGSGIAADRVAAGTQLPIHVVEAELKSYAKSGAGLAAKRLDGRLVLFREGSAAAARAGGSDMPMIDRLKALFNRKGDHEKKIAFLSERRAALGQQRDRAYEEISTLEQKDTQLRSDFKSAAAELAKRRISSQLVQLQKDMQRRQQMIAVLNQQINIVSTHLHNLELVHHGKSAKLPDSEEMASDAAAAEEVLANLEADHELAESVSGIAPAGMSDEEQAMYEQLMSDSGAAVPESTPIRESPVKPPPLAAEKRPQPKRSEPEAG